MGCGAEAAGEERKEMMGCKKRIAWKQYPLRVCRWMNECRVCGRVISSGQKYYDGGHGIRAHKMCADDVCTERIIRAMKEEAREVIP